MKDTAIDTLRLICILAVIAIHTTTRSLEAVHLNITLLPATLFINQVLRFAVPLFFMISGFVLQLNYHRHTHWLAFYKKRASRILLPYLFWSIFYYYFIYHQSTPFFQALLTGDAAYHLYFIPSLLFFYALFPLLNRYLKFFTHPLVLLFLVLVQISILEADYRQLVETYDPLKVVTMNYFVFILGTAAASVKTKILKWLNYLWPILLPLSLFFGYRVYLQGKLQYLATFNYRFFYSQWRPSVLYYTLALAPVLYFLLSRFPKISLLVERLSSLIFVVFFVHVLVLEAVWLGLQPFVTSVIVQQFWFDPLQFVFVATLSFIVALFLRRIPILNRLTG